MSYDHDLLIRIKANTETIMLNQEKHDVRIASLEKHRNILHGIWIALGTLFGTTKFMGHR